MLALEVWVFVQHRHVVNDKAVDRDDHGHHKHGDADFPDAGEVAFRRRQVVVEGDHGNVEAVQHDAQHRVGRANAAQGQIAVTRALGVDQGGHQHKAQHFHQPPDPVTREEVGEVGLHKHVDKLEHEVGKQNERSRAGKAEGHVVSFAQVGFVHVVVHATVGQHAFKDNHGRASGHGTHKEEHGHEGRVPQGEDLAGGDQVERTQRGLVQGGQGHAEDGQRNGALDHDLANLDEPGVAAGHPFQRGHREFDEQHGNVGCHAQAHFKQNGGGAGEEEHEGQTQRMAQIVQQGDNHEGVAQKGCGDGRTHRRVEVLHAHDVAGDSGKVAARCKAHAAQKVKADPHAPGLHIAEVGDGTDAHGKADNGDDKAHRQNDGGNHVAGGGRQEFADIEQLVPGGNNYAVVCHLLILPVLLAALRFPSLQGIGHCAAGCVGSARTLGFLNLAHGCVNGSGQIVLGLLNVCVLFRLEESFAAFGHGVSTAKQHRPEGHDHGHGTQSAVGQLAHGLRAQVLVEPKLLEFAGVGVGIMGFGVLGGGRSSHGRGKHHPRGTAGIVFAVNVVYVLAGIFSDARAGNPDQVAAAAKGQGVHGAGFHATGQLAFLEAGFAEGALLHQGIERLIVLEARHIEGTGNHAVPAAHALRTFVGHAAVRLLLEAFGKTGRGAGRVVAVEALQLAEHVLAVDVVLVNHCPLIGRGAALGGSHRKVGEGFFGLGQVVHRVAGFFATAATDAARGVMQHAVAVCIVGEGVYPGIGHLGSAQCRNHARASHDGQEFSAIHMRFSVQLAPYGRAL
ncbi:hypothetical protein SDC9_32906 [bioreactor metagenome]|uniref:Uncharacterized protein n=1 Tax=bioreactor metagenome TaxID=1076179 RepID=A0A644V6E9_9ZZZZ